ncbi:MAG: serine protease, partial [Planctomycetaceae bacterium]
MKKATLGAVVMWTMAFGLTASLPAQSVCLPAPRLLTTTPMGGEAGTTVEVVLTGEQLEDVEQLRFSHAGITAVPKVDAQGLPVANTFLVSISADCPLGVHEARVFTRLGMSSSRVFSVGSLAEVTRSSANITLETAMPLSVNSICNAAMTRRSVDHYKFEAQQGDRVVVDCAAQGVDSKLKPVLIVADAQGNDLQVERRGGAVDFTVPQNGAYVVKVHDLTFNGGPEYFYRLSLMSAAADAIVPRLPSTRLVSSFSWPPTGLQDDDLLAEVEPNNQPSEAQQLTLPCDIKGSFYPAADVDTFEFQGVKGEVWWIEIASERLGRPTDPSLIVQHVTPKEDGEQRTDVVELTDIPHAIKVSSNGYAYDGPPYHSGSTDFLGKVEIKEDGIHRLQLRDLFGGTRSDPTNIYRLIIRRAAPDFALVGWALHMELRNGDRNSLSKPIALRKGATMPIEVSVLRRDEFDGEIDLHLSNLPDGVSATGLRIEKGKNRGIVLVTASQEAPHGFSIASLSGTANINGEVVTRKGQFASMAWPVRDASQEIPSPRLVIDVPVSVAQSEFAPIAISSQDDKVWEVTAGESLTIPLMQVRHSEFSGPKMSLKTMGVGFDQQPAFDIPLTEDASQVVLDLAKLKTPPGDYTVAFYGSAVAKYREHLEGVTTAEVAL